VFTVEVPLASEHDVVVHYSLHGTAVYGEDYAEADTEKRGTFALYMPAGTATATLAFSALSMVFNSQLRSIGLDIEYIEVLGVIYFISRPAILAVHQNGAMVQVTPTGDGLKAALIAARDSNNLITSLTITSHGSANGIELKDGTLMAYPGSVGNGKDILPYLLTGLAANATVHLQGCHTGSNGNWVDVFNGDESMAAILSRNLPGRTVIGGKRFLARVGRNTAVGATRTFVNGVEQ
jgi:hypothetical protein